MSAAAGNLLDEVVAGQPWPALAEVGTVDFRPRALKHRHMREVRVCTQIFDSDGRIERVIGTANRGRPHVELYGWGRNVDGHRDATGWIYFTPLVLPWSIVHADALQEQLEIGKVYRLFDFAYHWTEDCGPVVCLFAGVFRRPRDRRALRMLQAGMDALAWRRPHAPRMSPGFRVPLSGECWAAPYDGGKRLMRVVDAKARHMVIATCSVCEDIAVRTDAHFPYLWDYNRCARHLDVEDPTAQ